MEVRPGEGGDDAVLFSQQLVHALVTWVDRHGCHARPPKYGRTITAEVNCRHLDEFSGTHRVQRQASNDKRGRRHTSTATMAVLDRLEAAVHLDSRDVDEFITCGSGKGGQNRNKVATAVTLVHRPSGTRVHAERQRSLGQNQQDAWERLDAVLKERAQAELDAGRNDDRNRQIASGERPIKSYTWNYQRDEVVDHSSGKKWRLSQALKGRF